MSTPLLVSYVALWILVGVQTLILLGLTNALHALRQQGRSSDAADWQGRRIPEFSAVDLSGQDVSASSLAGKAAVLLFVSPNCASCVITQAEVRVMAADRARELVVVCRADEEDSRRFAAKHELTGSVIADEDGTLTELFEVWRPPMAVRVRADSIIESYGTPLRGDEVEEALRGSPIGDGANGSGPVGKHDEVTR
jgi:peroxiredoxin